MAVFGFVGVRKTTYVQVLENFGSVSAGSRGCSSSRSARDSAHMKAHV